MVMLFPENDRPVNHLRCLQSLYCWRYDGISRGCHHMLNFADLFTGRMRGGLAQVNVLLSTLMGGCSGSANADAAMEAKMLVPEMTKRGYDPAFSAGVTATSACITPIIPPGITLILYATLASVSVSDMFLAGYFPGAMMCIILMAAVSIISKKKGYAPTRDTWPSLKEIATTAKSIWVLFIPLGLLMGLRIECLLPQRVGQWYLSIVYLWDSLCKKKIKSVILPRIFMESLKTTANIMFIIAGAAAFSYYLSWERIPQLVSAGILGLTTNKYVFLLIINIFLLICGMFLKGTASTIILVPLLIPVVQALVSIRFTLVSCLLLISRLRYNTAVWNLHVYYMCGHRGIDTRVYKKTWPLILALLFCVCSDNFYLPGISLFLPNL